MKFTKLALTAITTLGLLTAAPAAFATLFTVASAIPTIGAGYGVDSDEKGGTLLGVQFTSSFSSQSFSLNTVNQANTFTLGTVNFSEPNSNSGITTSETDNLDVSWTFTFTDPLGISKSISAAATVTTGSVSDEAVDYILDWNDVDVAFGNGGLFRISLNDLSFISTGTQTQTATISLLALPTVSAALAAQAVPEPASLALVGLALAGLATTRRRKQAAN